MGTSDFMISAVMPVLFGARPLDTTTPHNMSRLIDLISKDVIPGRPPARRWTSPR